LVRDHEGLKRAGLPFQGPNFASNPRNNLKSVEPVMQIAQLTEDAPEYAIPASYPTRTVEEAVRQQSDERARYFLQRIRMAAKSGSTIEDCKQRLADILDSGDAAALTDTEEEHVLLANMASGAHRRENNRPSDGQPWTYFGYLGAMMDEVNQSRAKPATENRVPLLREIRLELSRAEQEIPIMDALHKRLERLERGLPLLKELHADEEWLTIAPKNQVLLFTMLALTNASLVRGRSSSEVQDPDAPSVVFGTMSKIYEREIILLEEVLAALDRQIVVTNDQTHLAGVSTESVRHSALTPPVLRHLEVMTRIWVRWVDPTLGLPRNETPWNSPYLRFLSATLAINGIGTVEPISLWNLATKRFRPNMRADAS
jgi:hypothetical protein